MGRSKSLLTDVFLGLALTGLVLLGYRQRWSFLEKLEMKTYDMRLTLLQSIDAGGREIVIVAIDDDSIARLGQWPWPRSVLARMIDMLAASKPKVIGLDIVLSEAERGSGLQEIADLRRKYDEKLKS